MALLRWKTPVGVRPRLNLIIGNGSIEGRMIRLVPKKIQAGQFVDKQGKNEQIERAPS